LINPVKIQFNKVKVEKMENATLKGKRPSLTQERSNQAPVLSDWEFKSSQADRDCLTAQMRTEESARNYKIEMHVNRYL
jgi:hypothetical protein